MRPGGFTLLELMVVLALLALASAIVAPKILGAGPAALDADARIVLAGMRRAKAEALSAQAPADFLIDIDARRIQAPGEPRARTLSKGIRVGLVTARTQSTGGGSGSLRFFPDGSSTGGRIALAAGDLVKIIDVDWLTGRVSMSEMRGPLEDALEVAPL